MKPHDIMALEEKMGHHFQRQELIEQALTHSSQAREVEALGSTDPSARRGDNELLEFLGDAVLGLVTTEALFHRFPGFQEGHLSKLRAHLVGQRHLLRVAEQLQIGHYLRLGRGEEKSGGRNKATLETSAIPVMDFKSALQERLQAGGMRQPVYALVKEEGPEHKKTFTVEVRLPEAEVDDFVARAEGPTKKRAEQEAARQVLERLSTSPEWQRARAGKDL